MPSPLLRAPGRSPLPALPVALALTIAAIGLTAVAPSDAAGPSPTGDGSSVLRSAAGPDTQTSDHRAGLVTLDGRPRGRLRDSRKVEFRVAKGVRYLRWTRRDARGPSVIHVLRVNLTEPRLRVLPVAAGRVPERAALSTTLARERAVAGVNGDFFDIADTGAPLGVSGWGGKLLHAPLAGWNNALVRSGGRWRAGPVPLVTRLVGHPQLQVTNVNSPEVARDGIGVYTRDWGALPGRSVTAATGRVRLVVVRDGRVVTNQRGLLRGQRVRGTVLVGREAGAAALARELPVGAKVRVRSHLAGRPGFAIGGDRPLLVDGVRQVVDDVVMHPRTAVGVNRSGRRMFLVVVDGRSERSRGHTMVELADLLAELGAYQALNLDGGGSSTMVAPNRSGRTGVRNAPSDGVERAVPNGIAIRVRRR